MPDTGKDTKTYRGVEYRLLPGSRGKARKLSGIAGACRFVWNHFLAENQKAYKDHKENGGRKPNVLFFSLGKAFTEFRKEVPWLPEYSFKIVRYILKYQADAWKEFFRGQRSHPRFHSKYGKTPSFTIPEDIKIKDGKIYVSKVGWMQIRRKGGNPYPDGIAKQATVKKDGRYWKVSVLYENDAPDFPENGIAVGVDPKYTSQTCNVCGRVDKANRPSQSKFNCVSCGYADHADLNASANILASGIGATARGGAFALATPVSREMGTMQLST